MVDKIKLYCIMISESCIMNLCQPYTKNIAFRQNASFDLSSRNTGTNTQSISKAKTKAVNSKLALPILNPGHDLSVTDKFNNTGYSSNSFMADRNKINASK